MLKRMNLLFLTETKKDVFEKAIVKAFKPMLDILTALIKGIQPFVIVFTVVIVVVQLLKTYQSMQRGEQLQRHLLNIVGVIFTATLILTANSWLTPILKKVAGME